MRCSICGSVMNKTFNFSNLFLLDNICDDCLLKLKIKEAIIPFNNGKVIKYIYNVTDNDKRVYKSVIKNLLEYIRCNRRDLFFFLDDELLKYVSYFNFNENIIIYSVKYVCLEDIIDEI